MSLKNYFSLALAAALLGGWLYPIGSAMAIDSPSTQLRARGSLEERRAQREAEWAARRLEWEERRAEREAARNGDEASQEEVCECTARLKLSRPSLQWRSGVLNFIPRVDVDFRVKGDAGGPAWSVGLAYEGEASYSSPDIGVPAPVSFSGNEEIAGGQCGDHRYSLDGVGLSPVPLSGIVRTLLGTDQELKGVVKMKAEIQGCEANNEHRQFKFGLKHLGNLQVGSWGRVR